VTVWVPCEIERLELLAFRFIWLYTFIGMKDEMDLLWTGLKVRVKDTFTSTFVVAWMLWNWRALLYVIYPMSMDLGSRLDHIEHIIYEDTLKSWFMLVIGPLGATLFFLLVLPLVVNRIDKRYQGYLIERRKAQVEAQSTLYWTAEEVHEVMQKNKELQKEVDGVRMSIETRAGEIMVLKERLERIETAHNILRRCIREEELNNAREAGYKG
jgi:hypothetical protein